MLFNQGNLVSTKMLLSKRALEMTTAQKVEMSVTNNSLSKGYPHPEDHDKPIIHLFVAKQ